MSLLAEAYIDLANSPVPKKDRETGVAYTSEIDNIVKQYFLLIYLVDKKQMMILLKLLFMNKCISQELTKK